MAAVLAASVFGVHVSAAACEPPSPGLQSTIPANGAVYPGSSFLFFKGQDLSFDAVTVSIDGQSSKLTSGGAWNLPGYEVRVVADLAKPGQTVVVTGDFCKAPLSCPPQTLTFIAADRLPDVAPPKVANITFDLHEYVASQSGPGDCASSSDLAFWVRLRLEPSSWKGTPLLYRVSFASGDALQTEEIRREGFWNAPEETVEIRLLASELNGRVPADTCMSVLTTTVEGRQSESISSCGACRARVDDASGPAGDGLTEPVWGPADVNAGGPCDLVDLVDASGCACRSGGGTAPSRSLPVLVGVAFAVTLRRRRARTSGVLRARMPASSTSP